jgi:hypothetical protein
MSIILKTRNVGSQSIHFAEDSRPESSSGPIRIGRAAGLVGASEK